MLKVPLVLSFLSFCLGCSDLLPLNDNPPAYLKSIAAYKEGYDALMIYFILADANGSMTTADGTAELRISQDHYTGTDRNIFSRHYSVQKQNFVRAKIGRGAFEHEVILCNIGRIPFSSFNSLQTGKPGKVKLAFRLPNGRTLEGQETVFF